MRTLLTAALFAAVCAVTVNANLLGQDKKQPDAKKKAQSKVDPKTFRPDEAALKQILEKTEELRKAVAGLKDRKTVRRDVLDDIEIFLKAAENIVRFEEWLHANSVKWTLKTLELGLARARSVAEVKGPLPENELGDIHWQRTTGKWVVRAYRSKVDDSIQPYAVLLPGDYGKDRDKKWPLEVILHGRDGALTEAKFIESHEGKAGPKDSDRILLEVYGRGNNAYRWAGETDVFEAIEAVGFKYCGVKFGCDIVDHKRTILHGFSMGGAGTWHIGLHHPDRFCVIGPGAGFTTTHGYITNLPRQLPEYQEKCLRIYDAIDYAENVFDVPVVAYSGEKDAQKKAADNIESALKGFKEPFDFKHLIAPGLEHQMPKEWQDKASAEYFKHMEKGRNTKSDRIRFVTYTPKYSRCGWLRVDSLEKTYEKAVVDATRKETEFTLTTSNIRVLTLSIAFEGLTATSITIDGQRLPIPKDRQGGNSQLEKKAGRWSLVLDTDNRELRLEEKPEKRQGLTGPIDDGFTDYFWVVNPTQAGWYRTTDEYALASLNEFSQTWDRYFRGKLPVGPKVPRRPQFAGIGFDHPNVVLFGDPQSNPLIAEALPSLPITWTKEKLVVNGVEYDPKTHIPVLIYPNPLNANQNYLVLNSGHTFKEEDLKGTNALLYPRLGDWAVIKPTPTEKDPAAYEVVAAGLFDENWQFQK